MTDKEFIAAIDHKLDDYYNQWGKELKVLTDNPKIADNPIKLEKKIVKLNNKYKSDIADLLLEREDAYNRLKKSAVEILNEEYAKKFDAYKDSISQKSEQQE